jgi:DNA-binding transcriptional regulator YdaS (Cro superfamily)
MDNDRNEKAVRVIDALGGTQAVADICGVKPPSVSEWKRRGIPPAREQYLRLLRPAAFKQPDNHH